MQMPELGAVTGEEGLEEGTGSRPATPHQDGIEVERPLPKLPTLQQGEVQSKKADVPVSKLRRVAVKLAKNKSHRDFLETCKGNNVIPRGFRIKWTSHFDESGKMIQGILTRASHELVRASADLAQQKVTRLEQEYETLFQQVKSGSENGDCNKIEDVIKRDVQKSEETILEVKKQETEEATTHRS